VIFAIVWEIVPHFVIIIEEYNKGRIKEIKTD
jgi:hypothetical protein